MDKTQISWEIEVSMIAIDFIKREIIKILTSVLIILLLLAGTFYLFKIGCFTAEILILLFLYVGLSLIIFINCKTKFCVTYILGDKCIYCTSTTKLKNVNWISEKLNLLDTSMNWNGIRSIIVYRYKNAIVVKNKYGKKIRILCDENIFDSVNAYIQKKCPRVYPILK